MINPYTILGGLLLLIATALGGAHFGAKLEREEWQRKEIVTLAKAADDLQKEFVRYERMVKFNEAKSVKAANDHEKIIQDLKGQHAAAVADSRRTGGLRIPRSTCTRQDSGTAAAPSAVEPDGSAASAGLAHAGADGSVQEDTSVRLPPQLENDLFDIAEDADKLAEQLRSLQKWVRDNGLYGPPIEK